MDYGGSGQLLVSERGLSGDEYGIVVSCHRAVSRNVNLNSYGKPLFDFQTYFYHNLLNSLYPNTPTIKYRIQKLSWDSVFLWDIAYFNRNIICEKRILIRMEHFDINCLIVSLLIGMFSFFDQNVITLIEIECISIKIVYFDQNVTWHLFIILKKNCCRTRK